MHHTLLACCLNDARRCARPVAQDVAERSSVKRQLKLPVASMGTSDHGAEADASTVHWMRPSFLRRWPPVGARGVGTSHAGHRAPLLFPVASSLCGCPVSDE